MAAEAACSDADEEEEDSSTDTLTMAGRSSLLRSLKPLRNSCSTWIMQERESVCVCVCVCVCV